MTNKAFHTTTAATDTYETGRQNMNAGLAAARMWTVVAIDDTDSPYALGDTADFLECDCTSGAIEVDLNSSPASGDVQRIQKSDGSGNAVTIDGNGKTINGSASDSLASQYSTIVLVYNGTEWRIVSEI